MPQRAIVRVDPGELAGTVVLCLDNEPAIVAGTAALLGGWGCRVVKATDLAQALAATVDAGEQLNGFLVDYHLDQGNGIEAIVELRRRFGADMPAILITADQDPRLRTQARAQGIAVLSKPVKPAALRALLAQWRAHRVVAAE
jgi:CheY-like chemotaxis protein